MPKASSWWASADDALKHALTDVLETLPPQLPVLLLGVMEHTVADVDPALLALFTRKDHDDSSGDADIDAVFAAAGLQPPPASFTVAAPADHARIEYLKRLMNTLALQAFGGGSASMAFAFDEDPATLSTRLRAFRQSQHNSAKKRLERA